MLKKATYLILFLVLTGQALFAQSVAEEYNLKAAFIYNFTRYIEWSPAEQKDEFIIGVLGASPISKSLEEIAATKTVNGRKIIIQKFASPDEMSFCHILFISRNVFYTCNEIMEKVPGKGTLVVSEKEGFAEQGAAINFVIIDNKVKFEANTKSINSAGLKASSQLLKLAKLVNQG